MTRTVIAFTPSPQPVIYGLAWIDVDHIRKQWPDDPAIVEVLVTEVARAVAAAVEETTP